MNGTQKQPADTTQKIAEALVLLGTALRARPPQEFEIWFTWADGEMRAGWVEPFTNYQQHVAGKDVVDLLMKWQEVPWRAELRRAMETRRDRAS